MGMANSIPISIVLNFRNFRILDARSAGKFLAGLLISGPGVRGLWKGAKPPPGRSGGWRSPHRHLDAAGEPGGPARRGRARTSGRSRARRRRPRWSWTCPLGAAELVLDRGHERLPGGLDDVVRDPHRAPRLRAGARGDELPRLRRGALGLVEDAHLVVEEPHRPEVRVKLLERLAERVVERVDGPVARRRGMLEDALDAYAHRRLGDRLRGVVLLLDDHAVRVELEARLVPAERALHQELERRLRTLELEPLILERLELGEGPPP